MRGALSLSFALWLVLFVSVMHTDTDEMVSPEREAVTAKLRAELNHVLPDSRRFDAITAQLRMSTESPETDQPDEFARILEQMRIPAGQSGSSYAPNYRMRELRRAQSRTNAPLVLLPWVERGPGNVSGRARGLVVDPDDATGNTWFVGTVGGGIWKTTNAGSQWQDLTPDLPNLAVSTLVMAQSNHTIMYAGTGEAMFNVDVVNGEGMLKSTDRGVSWTQLPSTVDNINFRNTSRIIVDPNNENILLAATAVGRYEIGLTNSSSIMKSTDGGMSWTEVYRSTDIGSLSRAKKVLQILDTPGNFNIQFAGVDEGGILKSTDAGDTWSPSSTGITDFSGRFELAISPVNTGKIFAAAEGTPTSNLFVSTDAGDSWVKTTENGIEPNWLSAQGWYDNTIVAHPTDETVVYVGGVNLYRIQLLPGNQRQTTFLSTGAAHVDQHNLVVLPRAGGGFRLLNANDGGIAVSADSSANWSKPTHGMNTSQFYGIDKKPGESAYIGGMQDNSTYRSPVDPDASSDWTFQIGGDGYETSWNYDNPLNIIGGSQYNGIRRSLDGGLTYSSAVSGMSDVGSALAPFVTKIAKTNSSPDLLFAVGASGVWRSTNFGGSWSLTPITGGNWGGISTFTDIKISRANPNIVWAGARMDGSGKINVSTDGGLSFSPTTVFPGMGGISGLSTHPHQDSTAYVLFSFAHKPKILRTQDLGQTWEDISGFGTDTVSSNGFPDVAVYDLLVMPQSPDTIWAGTEIGLFESADNGASWHIANNGLPNVCIWAMTHVDNEVVVATHGRGIWSVTIPGLTGGTTFGPVITALAQRPDGALGIHLSLRSLYDSTAVFVQGAHVVTIGANANAPIDTVVAYPVSQAGTLTIAVTSYRGGTPYNFGPQNADVVAIAAPENGYTNDFDGGTAAFTGTGFQITTPSGFSNPAIHSLHPYPDATTLTYLLTVPIIVAGSNATMSYDDIALVEPGDPGTVFGDLNFYDYVVAEGTSDGVTWIPLADGYDCRYDSVWASLFVGGSGSTSLFRHHDIDLQNTFPAGQQILIRFRLFADPFAHGWGWAIDNLAIQQVASSVPGGSGLPYTFALEQNYPNPFNPSTTIKYTVGGVGGQGSGVSAVRLVVYDILGRKVETLVDEAQAPGAYEVHWDASGYTSGIYFCRIDATGENGRMFDRTMKMVLLK